MQVWIRHLKGNSEDDALIKRALDVVPVERLVRAISPRAGGGAEVQAQLNEKLERLFPEGCCNALGMADVPAANPFKSGDIIFLAENIQESGDVRALFPVNFFWRVKLPWVSHELWETPAYPWIVFSRAIPVEYSWRLLANRVGYDLQWVPRRFFKVNPDYLERTGGAESFVASVIGEFGNCDLDQHSSPASLYLRRVGGDRLVDEARSSRTIAPHPQSRPNEGKLGASPLADNAGITLGDAEQLIVQPNGESVEPVVSPECGVLQRIAEAVEVICGWAQFEPGVVSVADALSEDVQLGHTPSAVQMAWESLRAIGAAELGASRASEFDPLRWLSNSLSSFDERDFRVLLRRQLLPRERPTLNGLGEELGVTRERVRQIERRAKEQFEEQLRTPRAEVSWVHAKRLRVELGTACKQEVFVRRFGAAFTLDPRTIDGKDAAPLALLWMAGPYDLLDDGWLVTEGIENQTDEALRSLCDDGPVPIGKAVEAMVALGVKEDWAHEWIGRVRRFRVAGDVVMRWEGSAADKAWLVLRIAGNPLRRDEIIERVGDGYFPGSVTNVLNTDSRFARTAPGTYGLAEWGLEEYLGIVDELIEEIGRCGGEAPVPHLVRRLTEQFSVAESSVRLYINNAPNFARNAAGNIVVCDRPLGLARRRSAFLSRNGYRHGESWCCRIPVTDEVVRGVSPPIPSALADELGVSVAGESRDFFGSDGTYRVMRSASGVCLSSIRSLSRRQDLAPGDFVFARFGPASRIAFTFVRNGELQASRGLQRMCLLMGFAPVPEGEEIQLQSIAEAIGLPRTASLDEVMHRLEQRLERDLTQFLPEQLAVAHPDSGEDHDDLLGLLGDLSRTVLGAV